MTSSPLPKLFELQNGKIMPTEHCYVIKFLKDIMECFPDNHIKIYAYLFYMTCPNADMNPFLNLKESDKEEIIYKSIEGDFSLEDPMIMEAIDECKKIYETPAYRAYLGVKVYLDNLSELLQSPITTGRDGNATFLQSAAEKLSKVRESYDKAYDSLQKEQMKVRGNRNLGYDQRGHKMNDDDLFQELPEESE